MTEQQLLRIVTDYVEQDSGNRVPEENALRPELAGMRMFDSPIMGLASARDEYLLSLPGIPEANVEQAAPEFWLESAKTVISFFLPFTAQVRESNRVERGHPSQEYMHARIEGQSFIVKLLLYLKDTLEQAGHAAVVPAKDPRFWSTERELKNGHVFSSNWSERHAAYACGLGTFSLCRGIITRVGMAGRLGSLITSLELPPTPRPYKELEEYCTRCGACAVRCPAGSITLEDGKDHPSCSVFLSDIRKLNEPYYGCGKCQTAVPCENRIPAVAKTQK